MPPTVAIVVSCSVRFSARSQKFHAKVSRQEGLGPITRYVHYAGFFDDWAQVVAWFGSF